MTKILTGITLLALTLSVPALAPAATTVDGVAALVNEEPITTLELDKEYQLLQKELEKLPPAEKMGLKSAALNRLVDKKLVEQKVRELDIRVLDDEVRQAIEDVKKQNNLDQDGLVKALAGQGLTFEQYKTQLREQLERLRLMSQEVRSKIQVGEQEVRDYYDANRDKFGAVEQFRARHIFFKVDRKGGATELAKVEAKAAGVLKEARGGKDFVELVKKYSDDPNAAKDGGDLGSFSRSDMIPEIGDAVAALQPGGISELVLTQAGLHIFKLEERKQGSGKPFDQVKGDIEEMLYKKKADERFAQWVKDLRANAVIETRQ